MHSANIMQCISGPMECIKLHSISIRLRVPGLRACVRGPDRRPLSPPRRACAQAGAPAPPPNQERHRGGWRKNTRGVSILCIYYIPSTCNPHPKWSLQNRRPPSESRLCKISKIRQKDRAVLVLPVNGRRANPPPLLFFLLCCRVPGTPGRQDEHSTEVLHGQAIVQANSAGRDGKDRPRQAEQRAAAAVLRLDGEIHLLRRRTRRREKLVHAEKAGRRLLVLSGT